MDAFATWLPFLSRWEGGLSNHPNDYGGLTNRGITLATWNTYAPRNGWQSGADGLRAMTNAQWSTIARSYWNASGASYGKHKGLQLTLADFGWGSGPSNAVRALQQALNSLGQQIPVDGILGTQTIAAMARVDHRKLYAKVAQLRRAFIEAILRRDPSQNVFAQGWRRRLTELESLAGSSGPNIASLIIPVALVTLLVVSPPSKPKHNEKPEPTTRTRISPRLRPKK